MLMLQWSHKLSLSTSDIPSIEHLYPRGNPTQVHSGIDLQLYKLSTVLEELGYNGTDPVTKYVLTIDISRLDGKSDHDLEHWSFE